MWQLRRVGGPVAAGTSSWGKHDECVTKAGNQWALWGKGHFGGKGQRSSCPLSRVLSFRLDEICHRRRNGLPHLLRRPTYSTWRPRHGASEIRLRTRSRCGFAKRRRTQATLTGNFTAWLLQQVERLISSLLGSGWTLRTSRLWNIKWNGYSVWGGFLGANKNIANSVKRTNLSASSVKLTFSFYFNSLV